MVQIAQSYQLRKEVTNLIGLLQTMNLLA